LDRNVPLSRPDIGADERQIVDEVLRSGRLACGPMQEAFEREFAELLGARHAVAVSSGTAALHLTMIAAGVEPGDFVITTPFTFIATANAVLYERAVPLFVDIDPVTLAMDVPRALEMLDAVSRSRSCDAFLPRQGTSSRAALKAILPVHVFGRPMEMSEIAGAARKHRIALVEDACESVGAALDGVPVGRFGDAGVFAFYPNKQLTTGEGGMIVTDRDDWAKLARMLRNHGREGEAWTHKRLGYNYRLDELSAALGLAQLRRIDDLLANRARVAQLYQSLLQGAEWVAPLAALRQGAIVSWFVFVARVGEAIDRDLLIERLERRGVEARPYFPAVHLQPFYRERFGYRPGDFPHAEHAARSLIALPFHGQLADDDVRYVCEVLLDESSTLSRRGEPVRHGSRI
jgi:dTDP-4-amino-4,6-dideoxygalactose transaminase